MKSFWWAAGMVVVSGLLAACGGKVVVDVPGSGGSSAGGPGSGTGASGSQGSGSTSCMAPPDPATLFLCGGSAGAGPGAVQCSFNYCNDMGQVFEALCQSNTCICTLDGATLCTCALNGPGEFCGGTPHCCPFEGGQN